MQAFHWLNEDMTAGSGSEPPWTVGETRTIEGELKLCERGYHSSPSLRDALAYSSGPVACFVEVSDPVASEVEPHQAKQVSHSRTLLKAVNVERELRLWGCDCAERALLRERERGHEPDPRSWAAIAVARRYADGEASKVELAAAGAAARAAARDAARDAAWAAAWAAAWHAARDAARAAARAAAGAAEIEWQRQRFDELVLSKLLAGQVHQGQERAPGALAPRGVSPCRC